VQWQYHPGVIFSACIKQRIPGPFIRRRVPSPGPVIGELGSGARAERRSPGGLGERHFNPASFRRYWLT